MKNTVKKAFIQEFGSPEGAGYFAPGRVNLIGEHTDYNGGHVFPCALTLGTYAVAKKRSDSKLKLSSVNFPESGVLEFGLDEFAPGSDNNWTAYVCGVIYSFMKRFSLDSGLDIMIGGNIPAGAGLSSSASLEVLIGFVLRDLFGFSVTNQELALIGQEAENEYVGVNCGIMDQFASAMGKKDSAIYLDTATLEYDYVPLSLGSRKIIITNTNKKHALNDSAYNDRRRECQEALSLLQKEKASISSLGDLSPYEFDKLSSCLNDPVLFARAKHAVYENQRTKDAVQVLKAGDLSAFGKLMNESHISLRDDYEVSCPELDVLAETAWTVPGVIGSRMTGGGFGGCTISIVEEDAVDTFKKIIGKKYREEVGYDCTFIIESAGDGPRKIDL